MLYVAHLLWLRDEGLGVGQFDTITLIMLMTISNFNYSSFMSHANS
jgi:hypothetical protein